jgi:hypothetical protein
VANRLHNGFRLGYVALLADGTRCYLHADSVYSAGQVSQPVKVAVTVPEGTVRLWLIVVPTPSKYYQHRWDERTSTDDMWPYRFQLDGTDLSSDATVYAEPTLDGRPVADATFIYDVSFPSSQTTFPAIDITIGGHAVQTLGTAFQLQPSAIAGKMQKYSAAGPTAGHIMFYAATPTGSLLSSGSTANGYGHWFAADGSVINYPNGSVYSEFDAASLTFTLGQQPGRCRNGDTYTIAQALRYRPSNGEEAKALFVFNIRIDNQIAHAELKQADYIPAIVTSVTADDKASSTGIYDLSGRQRQASPGTPALRPGIYIQGKHKVVQK